MIKVNLLSNLGRVAFLLSSVENDAFICYNNNNWEIVL